MSLKFFRKIFNLDLIIGKIFNLDLTKKTSGKSRLRKLELLNLEERIPPAVPFSPAFPNALSINAPGSAVTNSAAFTVTFNQSVTGVDAPTSI